MERVKSVSLVSLMFVIVFSFIAISVLAYLYALIMLVWVIRAALIVIPLYALYLIGDTVYKRINTRSLERVKIKKQRAELSLVEDKRALVQAAVQHGYNIKMTASVVEVTSPLAQQADIIRVVESTVQQHLQLPQNAAVQNNTRRLGEYNAIPASHMLPAYTLSHELENFRPSKEKIFLASTNNTPIVASARSLCHSCFTGSTGAGKSTILRMLLVQLLYAGMIVYYCDKNYAQVKVNRETGEKIYWEPIARKLAHSPIIDSYDARQLTEQLANKELDARRARERAGLYIGDPLYLAIEELPAVVSDEPSIVKPLARLLREARQYDVFVLTAMQDALCHTLKLDNGIISNIRSAWYTGGDETTAKKVLHLARGQKLDENGLGRNGHVYVKSPDLQATRAVIPYADNEATFELLGYPDNYQEAGDTDGSLYSPLPDIETFVKSQDQTFSFESGQVEPGQGQGQGQGDKPSREEIERVILAYVSQGITGVREIARQSGISYNRVQPIFKEMKATGMLSVAQETV